MLAADPPSAGKRRWTFAEYGMSSSREALIRHATRERWNILFSGAAESGKNGFLNACLALVPATERLLVVEEARDVEYRGTEVRRVTVGLPGADGRRVDYPAAIGLARRTKPDRVIFGELGYDSCATVVRILTSGQQGVWATIEASGPAFALDAIARTAADSHHDARDLHDAVSAAVDLVVELNRVSGTEPWVSDLRRLTARAAQFELAGA